ncbi:MAG: hypothetical protein U5L45_18935 [Saprospiraceae bacterium]|nr:hypothetical protein [Saprospiraceae bacterium]
MVTIQLRAFFARTTTGKEIVDFSALPKNQPHFFFLREQNLFTCGKQLPIL